MENDHQLQGLDASHFQGQIDWSKVAGAGFAFAIVKATEGLTFQDHYFPANWTGMKRAGVIRGAYHFLRPDLDAGEQAKFFAKIVGDLDSSDMVPWVDVEAIEPVDLWQHLDLATRRAKVDHFLAECDSLLGCRTGIYTAPGWWNDTFGVNYDHSGRPLWLAHPGATAPTSFPGQWKFATIWQRSWTGTVPGIVGSGDVDIDVALAKLPTVL